MSILRRTLHHEDWDIASRFVNLNRDPDLTISPDGTPYLYRWHLVERNKESNAYLHLQVASDPERPLHDHPWDNTSHLLAGHYVERFQGAPPWSHTRDIARHQGQTITRYAEQAHRLILPPSVPYVLTLFTTGKVKRAWGFWIPNHRGYPQWHPHTDCITDGPDGVSTFHYPKGSI